MTINPPKFKLHCPHPWFGMSISYTGNISVDCCDYSFSGLSWDTERPANILAHWNHPWFQQLRKVFQGKTLAGTGCQWCRKGDALVTPHDPPYPQGMNAKQENNYCKALQSYHAREAKVEHYPVNLFFDFGRQCNLKCLMCHQIDVRETDVGGQLSAAMLMSQIDAMQYASSAYFFGGEPLLMAESRNMLNHIVSHPKLVDIELGMVTNGVFLNDFLKAFEGRDRLRICVSLDSWGDAYETIRRGASWDRVSANVERLLDIKVRANKSLWSVGVSAILMKSSIRRLPEYIDWCLARNLIPSLNPLISTRHTQNEDVLSYPELLREIPDWREKIGLAVEKLERRGSTGLVQTLRQYKSELEKTSVQSGRYSPPATDLSLKERLAPQNLAGQTVVIWGTGSNYRQSVAAWLDSYRDSFHFLGFVDNNPDLHGKRFDGATVYAPSTLEQWKNVDVLIVASVQRPQIITQLKRMNVAVGCII